MVIFMAFDYNHKLPRGDGTYKLPRGEGQKNVN